MGGRYTKKFWVVPEGSALEGKVIVKLYAVHTMNNVVPKCNLEFA